MSSPMYWAPSCASKMVLFMCILVLRTETSVELGGVFIFWMDVAYKICVCNCSSCRYFEFSDKGDSSGAFYVVMFE